jgi:hypothetical protein
MKGIICLTYIHISFPLRTSVMKIVLVLEFSSDIEIFSGNVTRGLGQLPVRIIEHEKRSGSIALKAAPGQGVEEPKSLLSNQI